MYSFKITSISTAEPVTLDEIKLHLRISTASTVEDSLLSGYITASRQIAEQITKRSLVNTQWELIKDGFDSDHIELPMGAPLCTATTDVTITYKKTTGDTTTLPSTCYVIEHKAEPAFIHLPYGAVWPEDVQGSEGSISIVYRAGYSSLTAPTTIAPMAIQQWIKMRVGQMYEYREPIITGTIVSDVKRDFVDGLLDPYRLPSM